MEEFLRSHAGTFVLIIASSVPFYMVARGSVLRWQPGIAALGGLMLALLFWIAWGIGNQVVAWIIGIEFFNSFLMLLVGWLRQSRTLNS